MHQDIFREFAQNRFECGYVALIPGPIINDVVHTVQDLFGRPSDNDRLERDIRSTFEDAARRFKIHLYDVFQSYILDQPLRRLLASFYVNTKLCSIWCSLRPSSKDRKRRAIEITRGKDNLIGTLGELCGQTVNEIKMSPSGLSLIVNVIFFIVDLLRNQSTLLNSLRLATLPVVGNHVSSVIDLNQIRTYILCLSNLGQDPFC